MPPICVYFWGVFEAWSAIGVSYSMIVALIYELGAVRIARGWCHVPKQLNAPLEVVDSEIANIIELEKARQWKGLELFPSENFTSVFVMQAVGSVMTNKYSEGYPGARYYGGNEYIDIAESLCQKRALEAFRLDPAMWEDRHKEDISGLYTF
ncbi:unnamed protein product [Ilex paraguariensis]|uniref:Serine hydroxymethyltransferase-like domain-containing protein n=1 Tax=Ilex paraguariensis TaxID=185542 RepID=A0ABC8S1X9_9AQUA